MSRIRHLGGLESIATAGSEGASLDADAQAYFAAMTVQPSPARKTLVTDLVKGLKADNLWTRLGWLCLLAAHHEQAGRLNLRKPAKSLTAVGTVTFTAELGFTATGGNYLRTGESPFLAENSYVRNSASLFVYKNSLNTGSANEVLGGGTKTNGNDGIYLQPNWSGTGGGGHLVGLNSQDTNVSSSGFAPAKGIAMASRTNSNDVSVFIGGFDPKLVSAPSIANGWDADLHILNSSASRLALFGFGGGFTDLEAQKFQMRVLIYLNAIGAM